MIIQEFVFNPFYENTYVLSNDAGDAIIFDPGCYEKHEEAELVEYIVEKKLKPIAVVDTHCHIDHVLGNYFCKEHFGMPLFVPKHEEAALKSVEVYGPSWGITGYSAAEVDQYIEGDSLHIGSFEMEVIFAPGHSPGHLMFYFQQEKILIGGDVLFRESIGRTDLPGGDFATLERNLKEKVYKLPEDVQVFPGHGPSTTIGHEKVANPFVKA